MLPTCTDFLSYFYFLFLFSTYFYRPQTKLRQGYVFTGVCDSVNSGVVPGPRGVLGPGGVPGPGVPGPGGMGACTPGVPGGDPPDGYCCGRYASYWNAFLFTLFLQAKNCSRLADSCLDVKIWCHDWDFLSKNWQYLLSIHFLRCDLYSVFFLQTEWFLEKSTQM